MTPKRYTTNKTFIPNVLLKKTAILSLLIALQSRACNPNTLQDSLKKNPIDKEEPKDKQCYQQVTPTKHKAIPQDDIKLLEDAIESGNLEKISEIRLQKRIQNEVKNTSLHSAAYKRNKKEFKELLLAQISVSEEQVINKLFALDSNGYSVFAAAYLLLEADVPREKYIDMFKYILETVKDFLEPIHFDKILKEMVDIKEKNKQIMSEGYVGMLGSVLKSYMDPNKLKELNLLESHDPSMNMKYVAYKEKIKEIFNAKKVPVHIDKFYSKFVNRSHASDKQATTDPTPTDRPQLVAEDLFMIIEKYDKYYIPMSKKLDAMHGKLKIDNEDIKESMQDDVKQYMTARINEKYLNKTDYLEEDLVQDAVNAFEMLCPILSKAKQILAQWSLQAANKDQIIDGTVQELHQTVWKIYCENELKILIGHLYDQMIYNEKTYGDDWDEEDEA